MDERKLTMVPGEEDWAEALAFAMECMIDHEEKHNVVGLGTESLSLREGKISSNTGGIL